MFLNRCLIERAKIIQLFAKYYMLQFFKEITDQNEIRFKLSTSSSRPTFNE